MKLPIQSLGMLAEVNTGGTPDRTKAEYWGGSVPWVTTGDIDYKTINRPSEYLTELGLKESAAKLLPAGTIIMAMYGQGATRGKVATLGIEAATNQACAAIFPKKEIINSSYLYSVLAHQYEKIRRLGHGGNQQNLNTSLIRDIPIPLPSLMEQEKIASIACIWDAAIDKEEGLIAAKEKFFSTLIKSFISDQCRHWAHLHTDNIFESISEKKNDNEELLSVTQDRGVIPRTMLEGRVMSPEGSTDGYKLVKKNDFVISLRSFQGGVEYSRYQGLISPAYTVLRRRLEIHDEFYRHFFKSYIFIEKYLSIAVIGIRDGKQISAPDFMTVKIPYPPLEQQKEIANILNTARQEIDFLQGQLAAYRKQKSGLMQKLLTGEWRVKTAEEVS